MAVTPFLETPPRAWGRRLSLSVSTPPIGNTPTGVGKTTALPSAFAFSRKHPHGRGEDVLVVALPPCLQETPPRAWGRPGKEVAPASVTAETPPRAWGRLRMGYAAARLERNTPTGVGKTSISRGAFTAARKHPHGRGEDGSCKALRLWDGETPPRAWGRLKKLRELVRTARNTPTGVGKTPP